MGEGEKNEDADKIGGPDNDFFVGGQPDRGFVNAGEEHVGTYDEAMLDDTILYLENLCEGSNVVTAIGEISDEENKKNDWAAGVVEVLMTVSTILQFFRDGNKINEVHYTRIAAEIETFINAARDAVFGAGNNLEGIADRIATICTDIKANLVS